MVATSTASAADDIGDGVGPNANERADEASTRSTGDERRTTGAPAEHRVDEESW